MERVIDCPVCFDVDRCFEEIQEDYSSFLCFNCGFMSDSRYEVGSLQLTDNLKKSPKLVQDLKIKDNYVIAMRRRRVRTKLYNLLVTSDV